MPALRKHPPETVIGARQDYAAGMATKAICAKWEICNGSLYQWVKGEAAARDLPPLVQRRPGTRRRRPTKSQKLALVRRLWDVADRQMREIEHRLGTAQQPSDREADMRLLSMLMRTVRDLDALDRRGEEAAKAEGTSNNTNDDADVRDIEEFRRELARKMDAVIAARASAGDGKLHEA